VPFGSINFAERKKNTPMDLLHATPAVNTQRNETAMYAQHNCKAVCKQARKRNGAFREKFWDKLNQRIIDWNNEHAGMQIPLGVAVGACDGTKHLGRHQVDHGAYGYDINAGHAKHYKFTVTMEHSEEVNNWGYLTEKIVSPMLGGSVPVYMGASEVGQVFRPDSFISANEDMDGALDRMMELLKDSKKYEAMQNAPAVSDASMRIFFSWHPSVWPTHGDELRKRIIGSALEACEAV
jgi:hypothetical protein